MARETPHPYFLLVTIPNPESAFAGRTCAVVSRTQTSAGTWMYGLVAIQWSQSGASVYSFSPVKTLFKHASIEPDPSPTIGARANFLQTIRGWGGYTGPEMLKDWRRAVVELNVSAARVLVRTRSTEQLQHVKRFAHAAFKAARERGSVKGRVREGRALWKLALSDYHSLLL